MSDIKFVWQRAVIKVGSALIAPEGKGSSIRFLLALADFIHRSMRQGKQVVIVSSGSVAAGAGLMNFSMTEKPTIPQKQALAAIGQSHLMQHWQKLFDHHCAQILLTRSDLESDKRLFNAKNTLNTLFEMQAIPIINENDSVVIDELVVGDNDNLAARVAVMCDADLLIICSDVNGLYTKNPRLNKDAEFISKVEEIDQHILSYAEITNNPIATGGMQTKIQAAQITLKAGINTIIVNGRKASTFEKLKNSKTNGTVFVGLQSKILI